MQVLQNAELIMQLILAGGLGLFAWVEGHGPRVPNQPDKWARWQTNVALYVVGSVLMVLAFDPFNMQAIRLGATLGWGGVAAMPWPTWLKLILGVLILDLLQYGLHVLSHYVPWWWRLHKVHHCDTSMDASTALRHHPFELFLNSFILVALSAALGLPVLAILLYAVLQPIHTLFCHSNLGLSPTWDRWLRLGLITPDMHAIHHSVRMDEGNSNFGMVFPWWDHLFASYLAQPASGHRSMQMGIAELANKPKVDLLALLGLPFKKIRHPIAS
jgi:sterol desaturase/sphingolipid hydroxylase (fatty acid hydroxylase superfamily)